MQSYTFRSLVHEMESSNSNLAEVAVGRMMDIIFEDTGEYPQWSDEAPDWVVKCCIPGM